MAGLLAAVRGTFNTVPDSRKPGSVVYTMSDTLSAALAMFSLKYSSLLQFDTDVRASEGAIRHNLKTLFGVSNAPSDSQMRDIIDPEEPALLRPAFRALHSSLQRGNILKRVAWKDGKYLLSIDGTGVFASSKIKCKHCCMKKRKTGEEYYHQLVAAAIVHPEHKRALPLDFEPITRHDGNTKNDCERNAGKRLLHSIREQYPDRKFVVLEDALAANGPHIRELIHHQMDFIIGAKPGSNASLFEEVFERMNRSQCIESAPDDLNAKGLSCGYRFTNNIALNESNPDLFVNFIEYWEFDKKGKQTIFSWVTNLPISAENAYEIAQAGRTRWKVENELFNVMKNQGYNLEHSYGHGKQYLCSTLGGLMLLAFLIDQIQELACRLFQAARAAYHARIVLWEKQRALFFTFDIPDWESLMRTLANLDSIRTDYGHTTGKETMDVNNNGTVWDEVGVVAAAASFVATGNAAVAVTVAGATATIATYDTSNMGK